MVNLGKALRAVCQITVYTPTTVYTGNGAFVAPNRVLTAAHVLEGEQQVKVTDYQGRTVFKKLRQNGGQHFRHKDWDLAVIELEQPIGQTCVRFNPIAQKFGSSDRNYLITNFNGELSSHEVTIMSLKNSGRAIFESSTLITHGHSGSVLIDEKGHIVSVVSNTFAELQEVAQIFNNIGSFFGDNPSHPIIFMGPNPENARKFAKQALLLDNN